MTKRTASYGDHLPNVRRGRDRKRKATTLPRDIREHLIEHLEGEIQWWEGTVVGGSKCPACCADEGPEHKCLYRQAHELLELLKFGEKHNLIELCE